MRTYFESLFWWRWILSITTGRRYRNRKPLTRSEKLLVKGVFMDNPVINLVVGQSVPVSAQPLLADGITPSGGVVSGASYSDYDNNVASTDANGNVTALKPGLSYVTIYNTVTDTNGAVSTLSCQGQINVTATPPPPPPPPPTPLTASEVLVFGTVVNPS